MIRILTGIYKSTIFALIAHLALTIVVFYVLKFFGIVTSLPSNLNITIYDAAWLKSIVEKGYFFSDSVQSSVAYFPLFPLLWKLTGLDAIGISIVNYITFLISCGILAKTYQLDKRLLLLLMSIPSLIFCYLPYTESLFFFSGTLLLYGLKKSHWIAYLGIFLACFCRSASLIFIPIIIIMKIYNLSGKKGFDSKAMLNGGFLVVSALASTILVNYYQYLETGKFFAIFESTRLWHREFGIPKLFFTTWDSGRLIWLDGLGLLCGVLALFTSFHLLARKLLKSSRTASEDFLFSVGYIAASAITTVIYTGEDAAGGSTLLSLNRYIFATPFFFVLVIYNSKFKKKWTTRVLWFTAISIINWSMFDFWGELNAMGGIEPSKTSTKLYFLFIFCYSLGFFLMGKKSIRLKFWSGYYVFNLILQIILFNFFMQQIWIG